MQSIRHKARELLTKVLPEKVGQNVEISIYNYVVRTSKEKKLVMKYNRTTHFMYSSKLRTILSNMKHLKEKIIAGDISYDRLPYLTHTQMCTHGPHADMENRIVKRERINKELTSRINADYQTGVYKCNCCESHRTVHQFLNMTSNEHSVIFITCMVCKKSWNE
jgi:hypothetical protein